MTLISTCADDTAPCWRDLGGELKSSAAQNAARPSSSKSAATTPQKAEKDNTFPHRTSKDLYGPSLEGRAIIAKQAAAAIVSQDPYPDFGGAVYRPYTPYLEAVLAEMQVYKERVQREKDAQAALAEIKVHRARVQREKNAESIKEEAKQRSRERQQIQENLALKWELAMRKRPVPSTAPHAGEAGEEEEMLRKKEDEMTAKMSELCLQAERGSRDQGENVKRVFGRVERMYEDVRKEAHKDRAGGGKATQKYIIDEMRSFGMPKRVDEYKKKLEGSDDNDQRSGYLDDDRKPRYICGDWAYYYAHSRSSRLPPQALAGDAGRAGTVQGDARNVPNQENIERPRTHMR